MNIIRTLFSQFCLYIVTSRAFVVFSFMMADFTSVMSIYVFNFCGLISGMSVTESCLKSFQNIQWWFWLFVQYCLHIHQDLPPVTGGFSSPNANNARNVSIAWRHHNSLTLRWHGPLTIYVKLRVAHAPGMRERFPRHRLERKPLVSDPGMHHGASRACRDACRDR